jgi:hypothetical protein
MNWWFVALNDIAVPAESKFSSKSLGEWFSPVEAAGVEGLTVVVDPNSKVGNGETFKRLQDLRDFPVLKFLDIPTDAIEYVDIERIAPRLEYLRLSPARTVSGHEVGLAKNLQFFDVTFPRLKSLYSSFPTICYRNIDVTRFPKLQWLETDLELDKSARSLKLFRDVSTILGFGLNGVTKKDILKELNRTLTALEFADIRTRALDLSPLSEFTELQYMSIASSRIALDARPLAKVSRLIELELVWLKRIDHIEALLDSRSLRRVSIRRVGEGGPDDAMCRQFAARFKSFEFM